MPAELTATDQERLGLALETRKGFEVMEVARDRAEHRDIAAVVDGILAALTARDGKALEAFYRQDNSFVFYGAPGVSTRSKGTQAHLERCITCLQAFKEVKSQRNDDLQIRLSGPLAVATMTGTNDVVNEDGSKGHSDWRWTLTLENVKGRWLVSHEHLSFFEPTAAR